MSIVEGVIEAGVADGSFAPVDPTVTAMVTLRFGFWAWTWYERDESRPPGALAAQLVRIDQGGLVRAASVVPDTQQLDERIAALVRRIIESLDTPDPNLAGE